MTAPIGAAQNLNLAAENQSPLKNPISEENSVNSSANDPNNNNK
jgi:hypothetical protein